MNIHPNHKDLLKHATTQEKRIERDTIDPVKVFKPRHGKSNSMARYLDKDELDVSSEQEPDYMTELANDPAYQEFIDNVNSTPF